MSFYVIDQNWFRSDVFAAQLKETDDVQYVITDTAMLEMCKGDEWESTMLRSLKAAAGHPERIEVSKAPNELMNEECFNCIPTSSSTVIAAERTRQFRLLLTEIKEGIPDGPNLKHIRQHIVPQQEFLAQQQLNHSRNLEMLRDGCNTRKTELEKLDTVKIKAIRQDGPERLKWVQTVIVPSIRTMLKTFLVEKNVAENDAVKFSKCDSFLLRRELAFRLLTLQWVSEGGIESLPEEKATNDLQDIAYISIASYGEGILSKDKKVNIIFDNLKKVLNTLTRTP